MSHPQTPIPIHPATDACGGCATVGRPCPDPRLTGDGELLQRAMDSLRGVVDPAGGGNLIDLRLVKALRIEAGEVELTLTFAPLCGSARQLAEGAFEVLRRSLPDNDIYVLHAA